MNKIVIASCCLLSLAVSCIPAYASPTDKKITVACDVAGGTDVITGTATVTLCSSIDLTLPISQQCVGDIYVCPTVNCDSSAANTSMTISCPTSFKVKGLIATVGYTDGTTTESTTKISTLGGKGFFTLYGDDADNDGDSDTVSLTVK